MHYFVSLIFFFSLLRGRLHLRYRCAFRRRMRFRSFSVSKNKKYIKNACDGKTHIQNKSVIGPFAEFDIQLIRQAITDTYCPEIAAPPCIMTLFVPPKRHFWGNGNRRAIDNNLRRKKVNFATLDNYSLEANLLNRQFRTGKRDTFWPFTVLICDFCLFSAICF
jgi:hypothetical protein